jgi:hypothetical protein
MNNWSSYNDAALICDLAYIDGLCSILVRKKSPLEMSIMLPHLGQEYYSMKIYESK